MIMIEGMIKNIRMLSLNLSTLLNKVPIDILFRFVRRVKKNNIIKYVLFKNLL